MTGCHATYGGGIWSDGTVTLNNSTVSGNSADSFGGGIAGYSNLILNNSTVSDNVKSGITVFYSVTINNSTVSGNDVGISNSSGLTLNSSIVANNEGSFSYPDCSGGTVSASYSLVGDGSCGVVSGVNNNLTGDPLLGPLANNGGPTQTQALLPGSPAIDKGSNPLSLTTDQRGIGFPRAVDQPSITNASTGGPDIGAFEYADTMPPTVTSIDDGDADNSVGVGTMLTYTVTFSEDIDGTTVAADDFDNAGTSAVTIGTVNEGSPGVVSVQVTPTTTGTIILRIPVGAIISDLAVNNLVVPVTDDDTVNVVAETTAVVDGSGNLVITDANGGTSNDNITISCTPPNLIITDAGNGLNESIPLASITGSITVNTLGGNDTLTIDLSGCDFINGPVAAKGEGVVAGGVFFNGGTQTGSPGDKLNIVGGSTTTQTFNFINENDGSIDLAGIGTINYTDLEPVSSTINATNVTLNYSTTTENITVSDAGSGQTTVDSNVGGETVTFNNPSGTLQINGGDTGVNTFNVGALAAPYPATVDINGGDGGDTVNLNGAVTFAANKSLTVDALTINLPNATSDIGASGTGTVTLAVASKRFRFTPREITIGDNLADVDFTGQE